jgi:preprotein translocase subunit SecG
MQTLITVVHIAGAFILIVAILLQAGKGAAMGSGLGAGSSQSMFGSSGAGNFLTKLTTGVAILFMITSLTLATISTNKKAKSVMEGVDSPLTTEQSTKESVPADK